MANIFVIFVLEGAQVHDLLGGINSLPEKSIVHAQVMDITNQRHVNSGVQCECSAENGYKCHSQTVASFCNGGGATMYLLHVNI